MERSIRFRSTDSYEVSVIGVLFLRDLLLTCSIGDPASSLSVSMFEQFYLLSFRLTRLADKPCSREL